MALVNYHNHTALCGHAVGTIDEYIRVAEERGICEIGFSDHAPLPADLRTGITMAPEEAEGYVAEIYARAQRTRAIAVKTGFEVDYPLHDTFDPAWFSDPRIDFIIGSCHYLDGWPFDQDTYIDTFSTRDIDEIYSRYYDEIERIADSRLFDIIGHFDIIKKFGHRPRTSFLPRVRTITAKLGKYGTTVEVNTSGLTKPVGELYPSEEIIGVLFEMNVPVTLGSDSHAPDHVGYQFQETAALLKKIGYRKLSGFTGRKRHDVIL
jgi:histidinol-phosphatase (PHP family)